MKLFPLLAVGLFIVVANAKDKKEANAMDKDEAKNMFRNMAQECKEQEKATDADVEVMVNENYPDSKEGKCLVACMQEQFGLVQDGKFSKEGFMSVASMAIPSEEEQKMKDVESIADECKTITDPDRCEQAIKIGKCMEEGAKKRNMKMERK